MIKQIGFRTPILHILDFNNEKMRSHCIYYERYKKTNLKDFHIVSLIIAHTIYFKYS